MTQGGTVQSVVPGLRRGRQLLLHAVARWRSAYLTNLAWGWNVWNEAMAEREIARTRMRRIVSRWTQSSLARAWQRWSAAVLRARLGVARALELARHLSGRRRLACLEAFGRWRTRAIALADKLDGSRQLARAIVKRPRERQLRALFKLSMNAQLAKLQERAKFGSLAPPSAARARKEPKTPESDPRQRLREDFANQSPRPRRTARGSGQRAAVDEHKPRVEATHEAIKDLLSDSDPATRQFANTYASHFQDLLSDPDPETRQFARKYVSQLKHFHENPS